VCIYIMAFFLTEDMEEEAAVAAAGGATAAVAEVRPISLPFNS
jgi:hypothetical protein